jgi:hypothetical protein
MWATCSRSALSENGRVVAGSWQDCGKVAVGERHGMCELAFNAARERHGMCESAVRLFWCLYRSSCVESMGSMMAGFGLSLQLHNIA